MVYSAQQGESKIDHPQALNHCLALHNAGVITGGFKGRSCLLSIPAINQLNVKETTQTV